MTLVRAVIPRVTPEDVMTPVAQAVEQLVINRKHAVMIPAPAAIRKPSRAVVMIQRPPDAEIPVTKQKSVVMILAQAVIQKQNPVNVTIQRPPAAEIPAINQNLVRRNGEHVPD